MQYADVKFVLVGLIRKGDVQAELAKLLGFSVDHMKALIPKKVPEPLTLTLTLTLTLNVLAFHPKLC